jgi:hypothetical protein
MEKIKKAVRPSLIRDTWKNDKSVDHISSSYIPIQPIYVQSRVPNACNFHSILSSSNVREDVTLTYKRKMKMHREWKYVTRISHRKSPLEN